MSKPATLDDVIATLKANAAQAHTDALNILQRSVSNTASCASCDAWQNIDNSTGACHRHPRPVDSESYQLHFPITKATDWCEEYLAKF